jgi:hypothetical protein
MTTDDFSPTHHALMFAYLAREVVQRVGVMEGEAVLRAAIRRYGEQRGWRMALRVRRDGRIPTMAQFLVYGEWRAAEGTQDSSFEDRGKAVVQCVQLCPWAEAWGAHDVLADGRLYCKEIDAALVRGFNPHLHIEVLATQTNDTGPCQFVFHDALPPAEVRPDPATAVLSWDYHTAHLYFTMSEVICAALGDDGAAAVDTALDRFAAQFGTAAKASVLRFAETNFDALPE